MENKRGEFSPLMFSWLGVKLREISQLRSALRAEGQAGQR